MKKNIVRNYYLLLFLIVFYSFGLFAQTKIVVLMNGKTIDNQTGKPVGTMINFISSKGQKTQVKSDNADGKFQIVLNSGEKYQIIFQDYLLNTSSEYTTPNPSEYIEFDKDFRLNKFNVGTQLFSVNLFNPNDDKVINSDSKELLWLKHWLNLNKKANIKLSVSSADSYLAPYTVKEQVIIKKKKKTKNVTITTEQQLKELLIKRVANLRNVFNDLKFNASTINIVENIIVNKPVKSTKKFKKKNSKEDIKQTPSKTINNVVCTIEKIYNM